MLKFNTFLLFISLLLSKHTHAVIDNSVGVLTGSAIYATATATATDPKLVDMLSNPTWSQEFSIVNKTNYVKLQAKPLDPNSGYISNYTATVIVKVSYKDYNSAFSYKTCTLTVSSDPNPTGTLKDIDLVSFPGGQIAQIDVISVTPTPAPANLSLTVGVDIERYYKVYRPLVFAKPYTPYVQNISHAYQYGSIYGSSFQRAHELKITWSDHESAEEYDLEWAYVNDFDPTGTGGKQPQSALDFDFKLNSTRVTLKKSNYTIPLIFERGWIVYRVRVVGRGGNAFTQRIEGPWSTVNTGTVNNANNKAYSVSYIIPGAYSSIEDYGYEFNKNWQFIANYAENGKRKESVSYFDGSLRNRQTVSKLNTQNEAIVGQTIYDYQGRPAIEVLPTPTGDNKLHYYEKYNQNSSSAEYNRSNFDEDYSISTCDVNLVDAMNTSFGSAKYYSSSNSNEYVPYAEGYPFTQIEYTPDNTGRIRRQGGVGDEHQLENGHETMYFYGFPFREEIDRLFGTEVGYNSHYKKNMVVDANGQVSISYLDQQGRVIATSLNGEAPTNLVELTDEEGSPLPGVATTLTVDLLNKDDSTDVDDSKDNNYISTDSLTLVHNRELIVPADNNYEFAYRILAERFQDNCMALQSTCHDCVYDLEVDILDECGNTVSGFTAINTTIGDMPEYTTGDDSLCENSTSFQTIFSQIGGTPLALTQGVYSISKSLHLNEQALEIYAERYVTDADTCLMSFSDFLNMELDSINLDACDDTLSCESCFSSIGTRNDYIDAYAVDADFSSTIDTAEENAAGRNWDALYAECMEMCQYSSLCDVRYEMMKADMSPGGQYAEYVNSAGVFSSSEPLSIYNTNNKLKDFNANAEWDNTNIVYRDKTGSADYVPVIVTSTGTLPASKSGATVYNIANGKKGIRPNDLDNLSDYVMLFKSSWADALIEFHPEYEYYKTCREYSRNDVSLFMPSQTLNSDSYDSLINTITFAEAKSSSIYGVSVSSVANLVTFMQAVWDNDPYFDTSLTTDLLTNAGNCTTIVNNRDSAVIQQIRVDGSLNGSSMSGCEIAAFDALCTGLVNTNNCGLSNLNFGDATQMQTWWEKFVDYYIIAKQAAQANIEHCRSAENHAFNGCIGDQTLDFVNNYYFIGGGHSHWYKHNGVWSTTKDFCSTAYFHYFKNKTPRWGEPQKYIQSFKNQNPTAINPATYGPGMANQIGYQTLQATGQCPIEMQFLGLLNQIHMDHDVTNSLTIGLNKTKSGTGPYLQFGPQLYDATNTNFGTSGTRYYEWISSIISSGNKLYITVYDTVSTNSDTLALITDTTSAGFYSSSYYTLSCFTNFQCTDTLGNFLIDANFKDTLGFDTLITMKGSNSYINCNECQGEYTEDYCEPNDLARDLTAILQQLLADGNLYSNSNSLEATNKYAPFIKQNTIIPLLGTTIDWDGTSSVGMLSDNSLTNIISITEVPQGMSTSDTIVAIFPNPRYPSSSYNALIRYKTSSQFVQEDSVIIALNDTVLDLGNCRFPRPADCLTEEHFLNYDLGDLLSQMLDSGYISTTMANENFTILTDNIINHLGIDARYDTVSSSYNKIGLDITVADGVWSTNLLYPGEEIICTLTLSEPSFGFDSLVSISHIIVDEEDPYSFTIIIEDSTQSEVINGTSCLPLKNCYDCHPDTVVVNLVKNYNLEDYNGSIPTDESLGSAGIPGWSNPTNGNPLYLHIAGDNDGMLPCGTDSAHVRILAYTTKDANKRDYAQVELTNALQPGVPYKVSYTVKFNRDSMNNTIAGESITTHDLSVSIGDISAHLSKTQLSVATTGVLTNYTPQVRTPSGYTLGGYADCFTITDIYTAAGGEKYITIGNFNVDPNTVLNPLTEIIDTLDYVSYYYIDNVIIERDDCQRTPVYGGKPLTLDYEDPCHDWLVDIATSNAQYRYEEYIDSIKTDYKNRYRRQCMGNVVEIFNTTFDDNEYHYTLYYYDQAGNLTRTVPPKGVTRIDNVSTLNSIKSERANNSRTTLTTHDYETTYKYNTLNQLVEQNTPDGGISKFWYDELGRLILSQNAKQAAASGHVYSYTKYDALGRIIEVGEINNSTSPQGYISLGNKYYSALFSIWLSAGTKTEVTKTFYDEPLSPVTNGFFGGGIGQKNLRNRVATVTYDDTLNDTDDDTYDHATHYSYDIHGNVKTLIQENQDNGFFLPRLRLDYEYDLVSGNVNKVYYQRASKDQLIHRYEYDADNRITDVFTSDNGLVWDQDAKYTYYRHGPLERVEIGDLKVQAMDYVYTIHGWIKSVNSNILTADKDPGNDGNLAGANVNALIPKDVFGFSLNYYNDDYSAQTTDFEATQTALITAHGSNAELFNGNIARMVSTITDHQSVSIEPQAYLYTYDQLNRIKTMKAYTAAGLLAGNTWTGATNGSGNFNTTYNYDANGNLLALTRNDGSATTYDDFTYNYISGTNKLEYVDDAITDTTTSTTDIDDQSASNYTYDEIGNLTSDFSEEIASIDWTVYGKVKKVTSLSGYVKPDLEFKYDANGNRIIKILKPKDPSDGSLKNEDAWTYTYYSRDASGNVMAIYEETFDYISDGTYNRIIKLIERPIYGSSRLGNITSDLTVKEETFTITGFDGDGKFVYSGSQPSQLSPYIPISVLTVGDLLSGTNVNRTLGNKIYEHTNHLGNVLTTVSDIKLVSGSEASGITSYSADQLSFADYYPFGREMDGRVSANGYRFGFNGKEVDSEFNSRRNHLDFGARMYNGDLGRFLSVDPKIKAYPSQSSYAAFNDNPILYDDPTGKSGEVSINKKTKTLTVTSHINFYGSEANPKIAKSTARDIQNSWNEVQGKVMINGEEYSVKFQITGKYEPDITPDEIAKNKDYKNNYFRIEKDNINGVSFVDGAGSNTGHFLVKNIEKDGSTTEGHEMGHTYGLDHPENTDLRGEGQPGIMYPRGTAVDAEYTYNPAKGATTNDKNGNRLNTMSPEKRKVTQEDIDNLGLDKLNYNSRGKANLGKLSNKYKNKDGTTAN